ncbi:hypothetical protein BDW02DRAFT_268201 [Decorospora gaudefroyi]|uniref:BZIP domain-containing protein n=1 Tax=Decorospora gaudefroyi TaxID=184978 RepID=A0A6A5K1X4_9PLEO|nr:hypothetical protein BDW02DRAFT_268201 [Decorospora gaudefroyi]
MSKKGSDTATAIRIRENQRRSRNQRKELIQDLQRRVQEFELKGIAATQDMQRTARRVAEENVRLRSLLSSHGVAQEEVDAYLRSFGMASAANPSFVTNYISPASGHGASTTAELEQFHVHHATQLHPRLQSQAQTPLQPRTQPCYPNPSVSTADRHTAHDQAREDVIIPTSHEPSITIQAEGPGLSNSANNHRRLQEWGATYADSNAETSSIGQEDADCPNTASCFCAPTTATKDRPIDTGLLISCETAATIIAEMRGDSDKHRIRASLGCQGDKECNVKNSIVLELMDER